ncbi:unnamed protein product, partial [Rotaria sp. Silwood2]
MVDEMGDTVIHSYISTHQSEDGVEYRRVGKPIHENDSHDFS